MKKQKAKEFKLKKFNIKGLYIESKRNILEEVINGNINQLDVLNKEVIDLLDNNWIYMKNKGVYYNTQLNSLFPDLVTFVIGFCPIRDKFNDDSLRLRFGNYQGRIMTDVELLKVLDEEGKIQGVSFNNYTVFLNGIRYINKNDVNIINKFNDSNNPYLAYHIPMYELDKNKTIFDENGYDLKYIDERKNIDNLSEIINLWHKFELIPEGLSEESENLYIKIMSLAKSNIDKYIIKRRKI